MLCANFMIFSSFISIFRNHLPFFVKIILNIGTPYKCRGYKTVSQRPTLRNDIFLPKKDTEKGLNHLKLPRMGCIPPALWLFFVRLPR